MPNGGSKHWTRGKAWMEKGPGLSQRKAGAITTFKPFEKPTVSQSRGLVGSRASALKRERRPERCSATKPAAVRLILSLAM